MSTMQPPDPVCRFCEDWCSGTCEGARENMTTNPTEGSAERVSEIMRVVHDLESWRAVEKNFGSRKLIDDAAKRLRAIDEQHRRQSQGAGLTDEQREACLKSAHELRWCDLVGGMGYDRHEKVRAAVALLETIATSSKNPHCLMDGAPCAPSGDGSCVACDDGKGSLAQRALSHPQPSQGACERCRGEGYLFTEHCPACNGTGQRGGAKG